jgi:hypothetical protein
LIAPEAAADLFSSSGRRPVIGKSKLGAKLGAIVLIATIGLAVPAFAAHYGASNLAPSQSGGGSYGYNNKMATDYRLKHHIYNHVKHHPSQPK